MITLSPKTDMAKKFHESNGTVLFQENDIQDFLILTTEQLTMAEDITFKGDMSAFHEISSRDILSHSQSTRYLIRSTKRNHPDNPR